MDKTPQAGSHGQDEIEDVSFYIDYSQGFFILYFIFRNSIFPTLWVCNDNLKSNLGDSKVHIWEVAQVLEYPLKLETLASNCIFYLLSKFRL